MKEIFLSILAAISCTVVGVMAFFITNSSLTSNPSLSEIPQPPVDPTIQTYLPQKPYPLNFVDFDQLQADIAEVLGKNTKKYGIYIYDLHRDQEVSINPTKQLPPASISKVPVAILVLRDIDSGKATFEQKLTIKAKNKPYHYGTMYFYPNGKKVPLKEYLTRSIIDSDNTAHWSLEDYLGGYKQVNKRTNDELGVETFFRAPHIATAADVGAVFKNIYLGKYLSPEKNEFLLNLLKHTASHLQDGIPALLPKKTVVAHKTGQLPFSVWEDAGIIYGPQTDFVMVVLNKNITYKQARTNTQKIAKLAYDRLNQTD